MEDFLMSKITKLKRISLKEELVALTGDFVDAIILQQFIYWSERVRDFDKFIEEEKERFSKEGIDINIEYSNGWIYKKAEQLSEETMTKLAPANMRNRIKKLIDAGWIDQRSNPKLKWDKTLQYRVNIVKLQKDLCKIGYTLDSYKVDFSEHDETKIRDIESKNHNHESKIPNTRIETAIPEITTESTYRKNKTVNFVPNKFIEQYHNFEQREYTQDDYEQFYANGRREN